jgi:hypothetical protein
VRVGGEVDGLTVRLVCTERWWHVGDRPGWRAAVEWEHQEPASGALALRVPADVPYSHVGDIVEIHWTVELRRPRRFLPDARTKRPVTVLP